MPSRPRALRWPTPIASPARRDPNRARRIAGVADRSSCQGLSFALYDLVVKVLDPLRFGLMGKLAFDQTPAGPSQGCRTRRRAQERQDTSGQTLRVAGWHQKASLVVDHQLAITSDIGYDHRL